MSQEDNPPATGQPADSLDSMVERRTGRDRRRRLGGWRATRLWGFLGFVVLVVILARHVILPFIFAVLIAYILAPVVGWMTTRSDGSKRMPRGLAIIICYVVLLASIASFVIVLLPRLSKDATRIGGEAPELYRSLNDKWVPELARWIEHRFPSMGARDGAGEVQVVPDVPLPPGTAFVITPLPDGSMAVQITPGGLEMTPRSEGGFTMRPREESVDDTGLEDRLRAYATKALDALQAKIGDLVRFGQALVFGLLRSVFRFFLVLMVAAFILIDIEKLHGFVRNLVPQAYRSDYDVIAAGINRGLSGVIRGQLLICLVNGVLTYIGLAIFGIKYSLILAAVAAIMSLVPIFGSILSTVPIVLAALVSGEEGIDIARAVFSVLWVVAIHFVEANFLNPKIIGSAAKIHPVLVIFALILGEHSYGLVGALLAVPVMSMIQVLFLYFRNKAWKTEIAGDDSGVERASTAGEPVPYDGPLAPDV